MYRSEGNEFYNYLLYGMYANCGYPALSKKSTKQLSNYQAFSIVSSVTPATVTVSYSRSTLISCQKSYIHRIKVGYILPTYNTVSSNPTQARCTEYNIL